MTSRPRKLLLLSVLTALLVPGAVSAQVSLDRPLRVFLDCTNFYCNLSYFVEELPWVDFVRDRQSADVHVLGTRQSTGGGGSAYTLDLVGRGEFEPQRITLRRTTAADATEAEVRTALAEAVRVGLAPFALGTPDPPQVEVRAGQAGEGEAAPQDDPWDRWTFQVGLNGSTNAESKQSSLNTSLNASAARVTEEWKIQFGSHGSLSESEFELNDSTTFVSSRESYSAFGLVARSVGDHWGVGGGAAWDRSTFRNYDSQLRVGPAVEYNVFPYSESNRRLLSLLYLVTPVFNDYRQVTIYGETSEVVIEQNLITMYDVTQPWGSIDASVRASHFIAKFGQGDEWPDPQYNLSLFGGFRVRLFKGLSAHLRGNIEMVRGQIHLPAAGLTEEEILTRQRELATNYRYFTFFGLSYRFGSIFSEVVNPRFRALN